MSEQNVKNLLKRNYYDESIAELEENLQRINNKYASMSEDEQKNSEEYARNLLNNYLAKNPPKKYVSDPHAVSFFSGMAPWIDALANVLNCNVCMDIFNDSIGTVKFTSDIFLVDSNSEHRLHLTSLIFLSDFFEISADEDDTEVINILFIFNLTKEADD
ncbi:MAG: hypothetical protein J6L96_03035 [Clostridia bacterium]|nr:hypothetical protein [Clostridia bacterium]